MITIRLDTDILFEVLLPAGVTAEEYIKSEECRAQCAKQILDADVELVIDRQGV
jgi:hypothetical protein